LARYAAPETWLRRALVPIAALLTVGCSPSPRDPSPESQFLQDQIVPAMTRWAGTEAEILPLARLVSSQRFDYLCALPEYQALAVLESEAPIARYRGHVANVVPETRIAVIGVKGDTAHVAYLQHRNLGVFNEGRHCYRAGRVQLRRSHDPNRYSPGAFFGEI
jgi:hypothetical protein